MVYAFFISVYERWRREVFLRGSPSYRTSVWAVGFSLGLMWIYIDEQNKDPNERRMFPPTKREIPFYPKEIDKWNHDLSGGKLLEDPSKKCLADSDCSHAKTIDDLRDDLLMKIENEEKKKLVKNEVGNERFKKVPFIGVL